MANLKITQLKSLVGRPEKQRRVVKGLGLKKIRDEVVRLDNASVRGMIFKVKHLVTFEETEDAVTPSRHPRASKSQAEG